mmetsp:Transcript_2836/g.6218  ORF Transcript_2836/g.6218 Transcript_2836/m.6218 type:complete len:117 (+) Transcript_2836:138-488(+)
MAAEGTFVAGWRPVRRANRAWPLMRQTEPNGGRQGSLNCLQRERERVTIESRVTSQESRVKSLSPLLGKENTDKERLDWAQDTTARRHEMMWARTRKRREWERERRRTKVASLTFI